MITARDDRQSDHLIASFSLKNAYFTVQRGYYFEKLAAL